MTDDRCGTYAGYQRHRKLEEAACTGCKAAAAADRRRRVAHDYLTRGQKMMVDAVGTRRRIQALRRMGWPLQELGDRLGTSFENVHAMTVRAKVRRTTAAKIAALYDELSMLPGPSSSTAKRAASKGWPPPLAWSDGEIDDPAAVPAGRSKSTAEPLDEVAIDRAMGGDRKVTLRPAERKEAVRRLTALGLSAVEIAERLAVSDRAVQRWRAAA